MEEFVYIFRNNHHCDPTPHVWSVKNVHLFQPEWIVENWWCTHLVGCRSLPKLGKSHCIHFLMPHTSDTIPLYRLRRMHFHLKNVHKCNWNEIDSRNTNNKIWQFTFTVIKVLIGRIVIRCESKVLNCQRWFITILGQRFLLIFDKHFNVTACEIPIIVN